MRVMRWTTTVAMTGIEVRDQTVVDESHWPVKHGFVTSDWVQLLDLPR